MGIRAAYASRHVQEELPMKWKTPKVIEIPVGTEINSYACATL